MQPDQERTCTVTAELIASALHAPSQSSWNKILERLQVDRGQVLSCFARLSGSLAAHSAVYLFGFLLLYVSTTVARAIRPMDFDELTTFYVATMNSVSAGWRVVTDGHVDLQPPLIFVVSHLSTRVFGANQFALRLPCMVAFPIASWCLYLFVKRRLGTVFAMCAAALLLTTGAYPYSYEARPYALVLAGSALALLSWQRAAELCQRPWSLIGISAGLGIAFMSHCYAVFLAMPFAAGEVVRSVRTRQVDPWVWLSFVASCPALLFYPTLLVSHAGLARQVPMYQPTIRSFWVIYRLLLGGATPWVLLALVISLWFSRGRHSSRVDLSQVPAYEAVAIIFLTLVPLFLVALSMETHSYVFYRYALMSILGLAVLLMSTLYLAAAGDPRVAALILILFAAAFTEKFISDVFSPPSPNMRVMVQARHEARINSEFKVQGHPLLSMADPDVPVVVSNPQWFGQIAHDARPALASRLYYLTDAESARRYTGTDFFEHAYPNMFRFLPLPGHVVSYSDFVSRQDRFDLYCSNDVFEWLMARLGSDQTEFRFIARKGPTMLLEACRHCASATLDGH